MRGFVVVCFVVERVWKRNQECKKGKKKKRKKGVVDVGCGG